MMKVIGTDLSSLKMKKYKTILSDPPWPEHGGGQIKRGADRHYPLMKIKEIIALAPFIRAISEDNCHLYLWTTNNYMEDAYKVIRAWGFRPITVITWFKEGNIGLGQYYRGVTEQLIFGIKGKFPYKLLDGKRQQGKTGYKAPKGEHSGKPSIFRKEIEKVSYPPYVEVFARPVPKEFDMFNMVAPNWDFIGNEVDGRDIRDF